MKSNAIVQSDSEATTVRSRYICGKCDVCRNDADIIYALTMFYGHSDLTKHNYAYLMSFRFAGPVYANGGGHNSGTIICKLLCEPLHKTEFNRIISAITGSMVRNNSLLYDAHPLVKMIRGECHHLSIQIDKELMEELIDLPIRWKPTMSCPYLVEHFVFDCNKSTNQSK